MNTCSNCGRRTSDAYIALWDQCPGCNTSPFETSTDSGHGRHARKVYDLDAIPTDPALDTEPECCS